MKESLSCDLKKKWKQWKISSKFVSYLKGKVSESDTNMGLSHLLKQLILEKDSRCWAISTFIQLIQQDLITGFKNLRICFD